MSKVDLLMQPFGEDLAAELEKLLETNRYSRLSAIVAFAKSAGVERIENAVRSFRKQGGTADFYIGFDLEGTSYEAASQLLDLADNLYLVHSDGNQTFHPKIYNLKAQQESVLIVGSHNLTGGGLCSNAESCLIASLSFNDEDDLAVQEKLDSYLSSIESNSQICLKVTSVEELGKLLSSGILSSEASPTRRNEGNADDPQAKPSTGRFPGHFGVVRKTSPRGKSASSSRQPAGTPDIMPSNAQCANTTCIWIETGAGTGGSNNQLDLSMTGVIAPGDPGNIDGIANATVEGSVAFFGVDPGATNAETTIEIEYEGKRYADNVIKIYKGRGRGKKPNGTWRLYLTGKCKEEKLTANLENGLANKLALFTRLGDRRFRMELLEPEQKPELVRKSSFVAHNGNRINNRIFGLL